MKEEKSSGFLLELKAKLASKTSEEMMARIEAEQAIAGILVELSDSHGFRIVEDYRYETGAEQVHADFILQVDDIELRLLVQYSSSGVPALSVEELGGLARILQGTQATAALALVWAAPDLPTLVLTPADIELLLSREELVPAFLKRACALDKAVLHFVESQTKEWRLRVLSGLAHAQTLPETQAILEHRLQEELAKERERGYRLERKVLAQKLLSPEDAVTVARIFEGARRGGMGSSEITDELIELIHQWESGEDE